MRGQFVGLGGWLKNSLIDYPGTVSTVLFYVGCNLRCPYCHNPALATGAWQDRVDPDELAAFLDRRRGQIGGVVLSGGEPTIHESAPLVAAAVHSLGYSVKLDTNGLMPDAIGRIAPDYLALDIKTRPALYRTLLGAACTDADDRLRASVASVKERGDMAEVRITLAPGVVDTGAIMEIAELVRGVRRVFLQPMQPGQGLLDPSFTVARPFDDTQVAGFQRILAEAVGECRVRSGGTRTANSSPPVSMS